ncbi:MAG: ABC transporter ATP-binding protein [Blautia sp.]|nr:ABC transporter ATP-binding protein [Blautia sp.]
MLSIENLCVSAGKKEILKNLSMTLHRGEVHGLTGASGAGKTTLIRMIMGFPSQGLHLTSGSVCLEGEELLYKKPKQRRELCGRTIGYIPQSPMTSFDPRVPIGKQMEETFRFRNRLTKEESRALSVEMLHLVNLTETDRILSSVPSGLSGGMLQRVAMALLLGQRPSYVLADEPTSALDEENREILLELMREHLKEAGLLLISHDVEAMQKLCGRVSVLCDGHIVEEGTMQQLLSEPKEAWTRAYAASYHKTGKGDFVWTSFA